MPRLVAHGLTHEEFQSQRSSPVVADVPKGTAPPLIGYDKAGFVSRLFWLWMNDLVAVANTMPLTEEHLGNLPVDSTCDALLLRFDAAWEREKLKAASKANRHQSTSSADKPQGKKGKPQKAPKPSVVSALFSTFWDVVWRTGLVELLSKCGQLAVPLVVQQLLRWYSSGNGTILEGVIYALILLFLVVLFQGLLQCHNFMKLFKTGMDIRTIVCARIYEKALTVSNSDRASLTTGEIVNLMSADAEKMVHTCLLFHGLWTTPLFLIAAIWLLVNLVGVAIAPGIGMLILCMPVQGFVIGMQHKLQKEIMHKSDARVKLVNEVLQGVRVVKYYNWEASFEERLAAARREEVALIKRLTSLNALNSSLMTTVPMLMLIAMLVTYNLTGGSMAPETIFVAVSLLVLIRFPLIMLPMTIGAVVMGSISIKRIERFLLMDDMPRFKHANGKPLLQGSAESQKDPRVRAMARGGILVHGGDFQWASITAADPTSNDSSSSSSSAPGGAEELVPKQKADKKSRGSSVDRAPSSPLSSSPTPLSPSSALPPTALPQTSTSKMTEATLGGEDEDESGGAELVEAAAATAETEAEGGADAAVASSSWRLQLQEFRVEPGTLVAVTGRVGSGKTSLLAALLNELDPAQPQLSAGGSNERAVGGSSVLTAVYEDAGSSGPEVPAAKRGGEEEQKTGPEHHHAPITAVAGGTASKAPQLPPLVVGTVGYAAQQPWIMNATLRENVLFGKPFEEAKYREVLECCCLGPDLATLAAGDQTEIGEKGINLSGGQKARVGLARSVYADPDVLLLDDVLAAVDAHVGKKLFEACILDRLRARGKTVVLVTNQLGLLPRCDDVVVLKDGSMVEHGSCEALRRDGGAFAELMNEYVPETENDENAEGDEEDGEAAAATAKASTGQHINLDGTGEDGGGGGNEQKLLKQGELIAEEGKGTGTVGLQVYLLYFVKSVGGGYLSVVSLLVLSVLTQVSTLMFEWWLSKWSDDWVKAEKKGSKDGDKSQGLSRQEQDMYLGVYVGLGALTMLMGLARYLNHARHAALAANGLFNRLLQGVLRTTVEFFDVTPLGRILNRFSKDTDSIDTLLPQNLMSTDLCLMSVIGVLLVSGVLMPPFIVVLVPVLAVYFRTLLRFIPVSRDLQRLESISRSPIFAQFSETLSGAVTVRAFNRTSSLVSNNRQRLDKANRAFFYMHNANRWLQLRLECLGSIVISSVAFIVVWSRAEEDERVAYEGPFLGNMVSVGVAGLVLTYTQQITGLMNWAVRMACEVESRMTSVERSGEYASLPPEEENSGSSSALVPAAKKQSVTLAVEQSGPGGGDVVFEAACLRYRAGLPLVLKDLNLTLSAGTKVGVCGRSGSGKSSLLVALFRITPLASGRILLGGQDIAGMPLRTLRRTLGIIPQDPVLFVGTLRDNLDAFGEFTDAQLYDAMRCAALLDDDDNDADSSDGSSSGGCGSSSSSSGGGGGGGGGGRMREQHPGGLNAVVDEGGSNWSTGQRQLICLARAVLRNPKVLAIDEATANIDLETDALVQKSIRERFKGATTLTIAHRLQTILDSDLIMTMDNGNLAESGSPGELLADPTSLFAGLCRNDASASAAAGLSSSLSSEALSAAAAAASTERASA